jgi:hypothetical protein
MYILIFKSHLHVSHHSGLMRIAATQAMIQQQFCLTNRITDADVKGSGAGCIKALNHFLITIL